MVKTKPISPKSNDAAVAYRHPSSSDHTKTGHTLLTQADEPVWQKAHTFTPVNGAPKSQPIPSAGVSPHAMPVLEVGKTGGTDRRTADRLRRGKLTIDMSLDLHGLTLDVAHRRLLGFLSAAQASGAKCVLVITGKGARAPDGQGRLRTAVPRWLNEPVFRSLGLSIAQAQQKDGGEGAFYVLLRKLRNTRP